MNRLLLLLLLASGIICGVSSCTLWRRVTGKHRAAPVADSAGLTIVKSPAFIGTDTALVFADTAAVVAAIPDAQQQALIQSLLPLWNAQTSFTTFSGKAKVQYEGKGGSQDFTASIRIEKDRKIWVSITALGLFEAARALITPDTIIAIDRIHKEVRVLPFSEAGKLLPAQVDFATLQSLIIGDVFQTGRKPVHAMDTGQVFILQAVDSNLTHSVQYDRPDSALHFQTLATITALLLAEYRDYSVEGGHRFSKGRSLSMTDKGDTHNVDFEFSKVTFDEPVDMSFSIPAKYERK